MGKKNWGQGAYGLVVGYFWGGHCFESFSRRGKRFFSIAGSGAYTAVLKYFGFNLRENITKHVTARRDSLWFGLWICGLAVLNWPSTISH